MSKFLTRVWYGEHPIQYLLLPLSWIYCVIVWSRRRYLSFIAKSCSVPIIVVGNLTVGGVGKTPLVIELAKKMQQKNLRVGIVSRGYKAKRKIFPYEVQIQDLPEEVGDEPLLIARKTRCPVVIAPNRMQAVDYLLKHHQVQVILSDDGLQHYRMPRAIEIAVIDGVRGLGNTACLPAGPLREPRSRLQEVDLIVVNKPTSLSKQTSAKNFASTSPHPPFGHLLPMSGAKNKRKFVFEGEWENAYTMHLIPEKIRQLSTDTPCSLLLQASPIAAVAGIGHPERFFNTLSALGLDFTPHAYPDHHRFKAEDLAYPEPFVVMTEKDAIKCTSFLSEKLYYLPVEAQLSDGFWHALWSHQQLQGLL